MSPPSDSQAARAAGATAPPAFGVVRFSPLGGLGEIGMNCLAIEQGNDILLVDCGVTFPNTDLGIDVYHPRFDYLIERRERIRGVVLTHGHEDHIGALPYLLDHIDVPVYGPPHALWLARLRLEEHAFEEEAIRLHPIRVGEPFKVGSFELEAIRVTHSIADAIALAIRTDAGLVVHTGDFKLDPSPLDGQKTDETRFRELGDEGVRLLLSDSTNVDSPGCSGSEHGVADALGELIESAPHRVVVGMFASNVHRLIGLGRIAQRSRRRICLIGRSVANHARAAREVGLVDWPSDLLVAPELAAGLVRDRLLVVASGTQAERGSSLMRLATGTHSQLRLEPGDRVILSSRVIPGNDRAVSDLTCALLRLGLDVVTRVTDARVHASGHAHREEQTRMIQLTRPRAFLPVHGTLHHLMRHADLARTAGVADAFVAENGDAIEIGATACIEKAFGFPHGKVATFRGEELPDGVLRERAQLGRAGVVLVSIVLDAFAALAAPAQVTARGVVTGPGAEALDAAQRAVTRTIEAADRRTRSLDEPLTELAGRAARRAIEHHGLSRPMVSVSLTRLTSTQSAR